jgi:hypothetical protein
MKAEEAITKLLALQTETKGWDKVDMMTYFTKEGVPLEITTRMNYLWDFKTEFSDNVVNIGKIIVMKLLEFIENNPYMTIGIAIGIGLGSLAAMIHIPFIGHIVMPIIAAIPPIYFGLKGNRMDKIMRGEYVGDSLIDDGITSAKQFWTLFADIINSSFLEPRLIEN